MRKPVFSYFLLIYPLIYSYTLTNLEAAVNEILNQVINQDPKNEDPEFTWINGQLYRRMETRLPPQKENNVQAKQENGIKTLWEKL